MDEKYVNLLLIPLTALQMLGYFIIFSSWIKMGLKGVILGTVIVLLINIIVLYGLSLVKITSKDGNDKMVSDFFGDVFGMAVWLSIITVVMAIGAVFIGWSIAVKHNLDKLVSLVIPVLVVGSFIASEKIYNKYK